MIEKNILENIERQLKDNGWEKRPIGKFKKHNNQIADIEGFKVFVRKFLLQDFLTAEKSEKEGQKVRAGGCARTLGDSDNPLIYLKDNEDSAGSISPMGTPKGNSDPSAGVGQNLICLSGFDRFDVFVDSRPDEPSIVIGFDSEWQSLQDGCRNMISWQFAFVKDDYLHEVVFLADGDKRLSINLALSWLLDYIGQKPFLERKVIRYEYCVGWDDDDKPELVKTPDRGEARQNCLYAYDKDSGCWSHELISGMPDRYAKYSERAWSYFRRYPDYSLIKPVDVTLVCHAGKADLTTLDGVYGEFGLLRRISEVRGGYVTLEKPFRVVSRSLGKAANTYIHLVSLTVRDTMCQAPAGKKSLDELGKVLGIRKLNIPESVKADMQSFLESDPVGFFEYASRDSVVALLYCSALYGYNNRPSVTITSLAAKGAVSIGKRYFNVSTDAEFDRKFRGVERVKHGKFKIPDRPGYLEASSLEPINSDAMIVQKFASEAFRGGYNSCSEVGYFPFETYDYDLKNAYLTSMCLVPDIDWEKPILSRVENKDIDISYFSAHGLYDPIRPFVGYCQFEFPETVKYPCIPVYVDGIPVYPRSSEGISGVYVAGPHIALALRLGAKVHCDNGYFLRTLYRGDMTESKYLSEVAKRYVLNRIEADELWGKGCFEGLTFKEMGNSVYGKTAQNVKDKSSWDAYKDEMVSIGCSEITSPVSAMMITSIVQCLLLAAQNQIYESGYSSYSVTTDGFISDCPEDVLKSLDLCGFKPWAETARLFLTDGDPTLWEVKHHQDDLVNFTTRGNVSLQPHGVCAHNSAKSGFEEDSYEDRLWLMTQVLSRNGRIRCEGKEWISQKDIVRNREDFRVKTVVRYLSMDFDMKRKPDRQSFTTDYPVVDGVRYEIAHFDTIPFETVDEYRTYRSKKRLCECLRTQSEWDYFFLKVDTKDSKARVTDKDWSVLLSCVMGYRCGLWDIPTLNTLSTVAEKCDWINTFNDSKRVFKQSDWKNARRPERQANMLPKHIIMYKLKEMGAIVV